jgi:hypothetical protein
MGSPTVVSLATRLAAQLIGEVYGFNGVGGNAHIVLDDWNIDDDDIRWCLDVAMKENAHEADTDQLAAERACLEALLALSLDERASALAIYEGLLRP